MERLREGASLLLVAQRRMGKTSLMHEAMRRLSGEFICLFVDLQKAGSAEDAIVELSLAVRPHESLWTKTKQFVSALPRDWWKQRYGAFHKPILDR